MAVVLNKEQIMEIIPHRDPFLLIDEVNELEVGKRVKATKYIKAEDFWFKVKLTINFFAHISFSLLVALLDTDSSVMSAKAQRV